MNLESRPPGRMITSDEGDGAVQPLWLRDIPASADLWSQFRAEHATSGLWPLLLDSPDPYDPAFRPWAGGELFPERMSSPADHDPEALLARRWRDHTTTDKDDDMFTAKERAAVTAPFGQTWPGTAPGRAPCADPDAMAGQYARTFLVRNPHARLGLVSAPRGADALTACGWDGSLNYDSATATFSAVVRDWEERFGARVVGLGFSTLHLSVAAPPNGLDGALNIAAEHFAFCPDTHLAGRPSHLGRLCRAPHRSELLGVLVGLIIDEDRSWHLIDEAGHFGRGTPPARSGRRGCAA